MSVCRIPLVCIIHHKPVVAHPHDVDAPVLQVVVADQLNRYLASSGLMPPLQSAYRACHSTETALLRVMSDVFAAARCLECSTSAQHSTVLTTIFCCCVSSEFSDYLVRCSPGCGRFWQTGLSASPTLESYRWSSSYSSEFRRAQCWARSYSWSIPLRSSAL